MKVAVAVGRGAPVRRRRSGDPADRRARRPADGRPRRRRALAEKGEVVLEQSRGRARSATASGSASGARTTTTRPSRSSSALLVDVAAARARSSSPRRCPRTSSGRGCCRPSTSGCGPAAASSSPSCGRRIPVFVRFSGIDYDNDDDGDRQARRVRPRRPADPDRLRRQRAPADARRQGRLPVRRLRLADRPRGRRGPRRRGRARAARPREDDGRRDDPDRDHARPAAQRHVRPRDAPDVRLPRRCGQPLGPADVDGASGADLRHRARSPPAGRGFIWTKLPPLQREGQGRAGRRLLAERLARSGLVAERSRGTSCRSSARRRAHRARRAPRAQRPSAGGASSASPPRPAWASRGSSPSSCATRGGRRGSSPSASARPSGRTTSYFVWREIWRPLLPALEDDLPGPEQIQALEQSSPRSTRRSSPARRCSSEVVGLSIPDTDLTRVLRRQAAQGIARGPAGRLPARARAQRAASCSCSRTATGSTSCRATCSTCSRAVARRCPSCSCSPTARRRTPQGLGLGGCPGFAGAALERLDEPR